MTGLRKYRVVFVHYDLNREHRIIEVVARDTADAEGQAHLEARTRHWSEKWTLDHTEEA